MTKPSTDAETEPINLRPVGHCQGAHCATLLLSQGAWSRQTTTDRHDLAAVFGRHEGRNLCTRCHRRADRAAELIDHESRHRTAADRADEYEHARAGGRLPRRGESSARQRLQAAGELLGCHPDTLRLALRRRGITP